MVTVRFGGVVRAGAIQPDVMPRYSYTAGEAIAVGEMVAKGETDGRVYLAQASDSTRMPAIGVAVTAASGAGKGVNVSGASGMIAGIARTEDFGHDDQIYVSATRGKATKTLPEAVGNFLQTIGRSINASDVALNINGTMVRLDQV